MTLDECIMKTHNTNVLLKDHGLSQKEKELVKEITIAVLSDLKETSPHSLELCTFFVSNGYEPLVKAVKHRSGIKNPRIEGDDANPFDQHYWLAFDIGNDGQKHIRTVLIDPIFGYVGLEEFTGDLLDYEHLWYYKRKRVVSKEEVRLKTIGI